jgi:polysaccharide deacetylase 2 family uncharacterized protein YibQ
MIRTEFLASDSGDQHADQLSITVRNGGGEPDHRAAVARLLQSLGAVATRRGLTQDARSESRSAARFEYRRSGVVTHVIAVRFAGTTSSRGRTNGAQIGAARLAIILDDVGNDMGAAEAVFALSFPVTFSILPNHAHSVEIAEQAHQRGYDVMLHLPMQSVGKEQPEPAELRPGMPATEVHALVNQFLQAVPNAIGVNNHQGSEATANRALMQELMPVLSQRKLFYIDSRTTAATVAYDTAQELGVPSAYRNVPFLDDVAEIGAVRKQLQLAFAGAQEKGEAIAIGHPHPATLQALKELGSQAKQAGVQIVSVSELVH